ncbi:MAG TPA: hypothetical protein VGE86_09970, partial [Thermoanaerobaculia bacterium]
MTRSSIHSLAFLALVAAACGGSRPAAAPPGAPQNVEQVAALPEKSRESALREMLESPDPRIRRRAFASLAIFFRG